MRDSVPLSTMLHIGAGGAHRAGFTAVDGRPEALAAAGYHLPYADDSIGAIYLDHVLEGLDLGDGVRLLQECRRVLDRGGHLRVVTEDLGRILDQHASADAWVAGGWFENGYDWTELRCRMLNRAFRDGGRRWLYDLHEVTRVGVLVGLREARRRHPGESAEPRLAGHEAASETDLIVELEKPARADTGQPLVSVLVPLYRTTYLRQTVASVLDQTYDNFELVLCDDGPAGGAEPILRSFSSHPRYDRIRYFANPERQGDARNYVACFKKARGAYIKFLNDDDLLLPRCLEVMAACLRDYPDVTLVTSHRQIIDAEGRLQPEVNFSERPVGRSAIISARSTIARMLAHQLNFIGEPSTVMFRKQDLEPFAPNFWSLAGHNFVGNGDVTMWLNLLAQGDLLYLTESLSSFRRHTAQASHDAGVIRMAQIAWQRAAAGAGELGLYESGGPTTLHARPLPTIPWWPQGLSARLEKIAQRGRDGQGADTLAQLEVFTTEAGAIARQDPELVLRLADLRFAAGDLRGALDLAIAVTRATPTHQPAHLLVARLLLAAGDQASARNIFKESQAIYPLVRNESGIVQGADGTLYLGPESRFHVEAALPDAEFTLRLLARTSPGFRNLPIRIEASAAVQGAPAALHDADLTRDQEVLTIVLPLRHQASPVEIRICWRGTPERFLPGPVAPLAVQIAGMELTLASPAALAPTGPAVTAGDGRP